MAYSGRPKIPQIGPPCLIGPCVLFLVGKIAEESQPAINPRVKWMVIGRILGSGSLDSHFSLVISDFDACSITWHRGTFKLECRCQRCARQSPTLRLCQVACIDLKSVIFS